MKKLLKHTFPYEECYLKSEEEDKEICIEIQKKMIGKT